MAGEVGGGKMLFFFQSSCCILPTQAPLVCNMPLSGHRWGVFFFFFFFCCLRQRQQAVADAELKEQTVSE